MAVRFLDPRAQPGAPVEPYELSVDPRLDGLVVGLVANGFPDSVAFLDHVESALASRLPTATFRRFDKGNASTVISDEMLGAVTADCKAVVAAYGH